MDIRKRDDILEDLLQLGKNLKADCLVVFGSWAKGNVL